MGQSGNGGGGNPYKGYGRGNNQDYNSDMARHGVENVTNFSKPAPKPQPAPAPAAPSFNFADFFSGFEFPAPAAPIIPEGPSQEEIDQINGENERDSLYSDYLDAANNATEYINEQIKEEKANAALTGVEYEITDEIKQERINNYFAGIWSESNQDTLENLFEKWGEVEDFEGFTVVRGQEKDEDEDEESASEPANSRSFVTNPEDEDTLGKSVLLGA